MLVEVVGEQVELLFLFSISNCGLFFVFFFLTGKIGLLL